MLRHCVAAIAVAIAIGWYISASAFAGNVGNSAGNPGNSSVGHSGPFVGGGGRFHNRGGELHDFSGRNLHDRFWRGYAIGGDPYAGIEGPYLDYGDYEASCGFFWVDRIFGPRIIRQRVYTCP
jgi:hypothetical protein